MTRKIMTYLIFATKQCKIRHRFSQTRKKFTQALLACSYVFSISEGKFKVKVMIYSRRFGQKQIAKSGITHFPLSCTYLIKIVKHYNGLIISVLLNFVALNWAHLKGQQNKLRNLNQLSKTYLCILTSI